MKTKIIVSISVLSIILVIAISSSFLIKDRTGSQETIDNNLQTKEDPLLCMIDTECDDENTTESEITGNMIQDLDNSLFVYFFWGDGCPHCSEEKPFLDELKQRYPSLEIKMFETWYNKENAELFQKTAKLYGTTAQGVPTTFIGDKYWVGFSESMKSEIENFIKYCLKNECQNVFEK